jgi:hypothetical protein
MQGENHQTATQQPRLNKTELSRCIKGDRLTDLPSQAGTPPAAAAVANVSDGQEAMYRQSDCAVV